MVLVESTMVTFFIDFAFLLTSTNCYSIKKSEIKEKLENIFFFTSLIVDKPNTPKNVYIRNVFF